MPTIHPRVNVVLEKPLFNTISRLARKDGVSLSTKVRDLVREAVDFYEDSGLSRIAQHRERTFSRSKALSHHEVWGHLKRKRA